MRARLVQRGWRISEESGDGYRTSAVWVIQRGKAGPFHLELEGLDDRVTLPAERAYAVRIREEPAASAYLPRRSQRSAWLRELDAMLDALDALEAAARRA